MKRKTILNIAAFALATGVGVCVMEQRAVAAPTYCISESWKYADRMADGDRTSSEWDFYNSAFLDLNDCNGDRPCDDGATPCVDPY